MAIIIDMIGAAIIVGLILIMIFGLNVNLSQANYNKSFTLIALTNAITLSRMMEYDLVKIGYHTPPHPMLAAKSDSIAFNADLEDNGTVHTVSYYIGPTSVLGTTKNPRDRLIYRVQDGNVTPANLGVTSLTLTYYDVNGNVTSVLDSIKSINVKFTVESPEPVDTTYAAEFWQKKIYPRNL